MIAPVRGWRIVAMSAFLAASLAAPGCRTEVHDIGTPEVRVPQTTRTETASAKILRDGETVGSLKTLQVRGPAGQRLVLQVQDLHLNSLGFIDERNCAWRFTAHTGAEFVAQSSDRRRNVAAILGAYGADIELIEEAPATAIEKPSTTRPATPAR